MSKSRPGPFFASQAPLAGFASASRARIAATSACTPAPCPLVTITRRRTASTSSARPASPASTRARVGLRDRAAAAVAAGAEVGVLGGAADGVAHPDPARGVELQIAAGVKGGVLSVSDQTVLLETYRLLWRLQAGARLLTDRPLDLERLGEGGRAFLLRETGEADGTAMTARLDRAVAAAGAVISARVEAGVETGVGGENGETGHAG